MTCHHLGFKIKTFTYCPYLEFEAACQHNSDLIRNCQPNLIWVLTCLKTRKTFGKEKASPVIIPISNSETEPKLFTMTATLSWLSSMLSYSKIVFKTYKEWTLGPKSLSKKSCLWGKWENRFPRSPFWYFTLKIEIAFCLKVHSLLASEH